jgi:hypothetical protein
MCHPCHQAGISAIRRLRKTDNNRIARAAGATICHRPEEVRGYGRSMGGDGQKGWQAMG